MSYVSLGANFPAGRFGNWVAATPFGELPPWQSWLRRNQTLVWGIGVVALGAYLLRQQHKPAFASNRRHRNPERLRLGKEVDIETAHGTGSWYTLDIERDGKRVGTCHQQGENWHARAAWPVGGSKAGGKNTRYLVLSGEGRDPDAALAAMRKEGVYKTKKDLFANKRKKNALFDGPPSPFALVFGRSPRELLAGKKRQSLRGLPRRAWTAMKGSCQQGLALLGRTRNGISGPCADCGGPAHEASGSAYMTKTGPVLFCRKCTISAWKWALGHINKKPGKKMKGRVVHDFYAAAGKNRPKDYGV